MQSAPAETCKHGIQCYYVNNVFLGCHKCLNRGKLLKLTYGNAAFSGNKLLPSSSKMSSENSDPFQRKSRITRSPPPPTNTAPVINDDCSLITKEEEIKKVAEAIITTDPEKVKEDPSLTETAKSFILQSIAVVKSLQDENILSKNFIQEQQALMNKLQSDSKAMQAEINELKSTKTKPQRNAQGQLKITQFQGPQGKNSPTPTPRKVQIAPTPPPISTGNKFASLESIEMDTHEEEPNLTDDVSVTEDDLSDPELREKRLAYRKQLKKKRKQTNSRDKDAPAPSDASTSKDKSSDIKSSSNKSKLKILPPPPIKVLGIKTFDEIKTLLKAASPTEEYSMKFLNNEVWKVNPSTDDAYRLITEALSARSVQWYSHSNKNTRNIKVLCKGLPPSISEEEIVQDLLAKDFKIKSAVCMRKRVIKPKAKPQPDALAAPTPAEQTQVATAIQTPVKEIPEYELVKIPVHQLDFDHSESTERIFAIKGIAHTVVRIEPVKVDPSVVPICKRCCGWAHTSNYCQKSPRCCKCSGKHLTANCPTPGRIQNPKCVNCGTIGHPASYRGCPFAKEIQAARKKQLKAKKSPPQNDGKNFPNLGKDKLRPASKPKPLDKSFSQALSGNSSNNSASPGLTGNADLINALLATIQSLNEQIKLLNEKVSRLESRPAK